MYDLPANGIEISINVSDQIECVAEQTITSAKLWQEFCTKQYAQSLLPSLRPPRSMMEGPSTGKAVVS
jgi:hypothetical protein